MTLTVIALVLLLAPHANAARPKGVPPWPWYALARCEQWSRTGVRWDAFSQSYEGAYGFWHRRLRDGATYVGSWQQFRTPEMPYHANWATPFQQTLVAMRIQRAVGWGAWPSCSRRLGLR